MPANEAKEVKMYSDYKSPFAYLAFDPAFALEQRFRIRLRWIPFQLRIKDKGDMTPALIGGLFTEQQGRLLDYRRKVCELFFHASWKPTSPTQ
jgi:2-hydroxychromene-2-carboxylate isomerase